MSISKLVLSATAVFAFTATAFAAGTPVNIADPTVARTARVEAGNRLAVQEVPPVTFFHAYAGGAGCHDIATAPVGKALIVRQVRVDVYYDPTPGSGQNVAIYLTSGCSTTPVGDVNPPTVGLSTITFDPGLAVPEGSGLSAFFGGSVQAETYVDGYTVAPAVAPIAGPVIQINGSLHKQR